VAVTTVETPAATNATGRVAAQAPAPVVEAQANCSNPNAIGISRIVEIDTTGGPGFGFEHFKSHDSLREGEVVLTFDDGPWPKNTPAVLAALAAHCTKAIFFPIGLHATYEPGILKQVAAAGHAVGSHTWCHQDLSKTKGKCQVAGKTQAVGYEQGRDREGHQRRALGGRRPDRALFPLPSAAPAAGGSSSISASAISASSRPTSIPSTCASPSRSASRSWQS
jgi:hypothetical protein